MKACVIIPTIRNTSSFEQYAINFSESRHKVDILIVDEGDFILHYDQRKAINESFLRAGRFDLTFFGPDERLKFFEDNNLGDPNQLIPQKAHSETSFGFLYAYKYRKKYDMVVTVDDDTKPLPNYDFLDEHWKCLTSPMPEITRNHSDGSATWCNTHPEYYARGFPYYLREQFPRVYAVYWEGKGLTKKPPVMNMGRWIGVPDLNAIDYLVYGHDLHIIEPNDIEILPTFALGKGIYAPLCSMNLSFKPEVIPAFYQLWFNDRYDDIFSGLFIKTIADHLGKHISIGMPYCYHEKFSRNLFTDAKKEMDSLAVNETLHEKLRGVTFASKTWVNCYRELAYWLRQNMGSDYWKVTANKMLLWAKTVEWLK
jgi:hypothetical protein